MKEQILKIAQDLEYGVITEIEAQNLLLCLFGFSGTCSFDASEVKQMYDHLVALFHRSQTNGLVEIDSYDRQQLKKLLKLPDNYR